MAGTGNALNLSLKLSADARSMKAELKAVFDQLKQLNAEAKNTAVSFNIEGAKQATQAVQSLGAAHTATTKAAQANVKQHNILTELYGSSSKSANKYTESLAGVKSAFKQLDDHAKTLTDSHGKLKLSADGASTGLTLLGAKANVAGKYFENLTKSMINSGRQMSTTGKQLSATITLPLLAAGAAATKFGLDFDKTNQNLQVALVGRGTDIKNLKGNIKDLNDQSKALSETLGKYNQIDVSNVQEQFAHITSSIDKIKQLTDLTIKIDVVGNINDLAATQKMVSVLYQNLNGDAAKTEETLKKLNLVSADTNLSMKDMTEVIPQLIGTFKDYNLDIAKGAAYTAAFTKAGLPAGQSVQALGRMFTVMGAAVGEFNSKMIPSKKNMSELGQLINEWNKLHPETAISFFDKLGNALPGDQAILAVAKAYKEMNAAQQAQFSQQAFSRFKARQDSAAFKEIIDMLNNPNVDNNQLGKALKDIDNQTNTTKKFADQLAVILGSDANKMEVAINKIVNKAREIGVKLVPVVTNIIDTIGTLIDKFTKLPQWVQTSAGAFAVLLGSIGPVLIALGSMKTILGEIMMYGFVKPFQFITKDRSGIAETVAKAARGESGGAAGIASGGFDSGGPLGGLGLTGTGWQARNILKAKGAIGQSMDEAASDVSHGPDVHEYLTPRENFARVRGTDTAAIEQALTNRKAKYAPQIESLIKGEELNGLASQLGSAKSKQAAVEESGRLWGRVWNSMDEFFHAFESSKITPQRMRDAIAGMEALDPSIRSMKFGPKDRHFTTALQSLQVSKPEELNKLLEQVGLEKSYTTKSEGAVVVNALRQIFNPVAGRNSINPSVLTSSYKTALRRQKELQLPENDLLGADGSVAIKGRNSLEQDAQREYLKRAQDAGRLDEALNLKSGSLNLSKEEEADLISASKRGDLERIVKLTSNNKSFRTLPAIKKPKFSQDSVVGAKIANALGMGFGLPTMDTSTPTLKKLYKGMSFAEQGKIENPESILARMLAEGEGGSYYAFKQMAAKNLGIQAPAAEIDKHYSDLIGQHGEQYIQTLGFKSKHNIVTTRGGINKNIQRGLETTSLDALKRIEMPQDFWKLVSMQIFGGMGPQEISREITKVLGTKATQENKDQMLKAVQEMSKRVSKSLGAVPGDIAGIYGKGGDVGKLIANDQGDIFDATKYFRASTDIQNKVHIYASQIQDGAKSIAGMEAEFTAKLESDGKLLDQLVKDSHFMQNNEEEAKRLALSRERYYQRIAEARKAQLDADREATAEAAAEAQAAKEEALVADINHQTATNAGLLNAGRKTAGKSALSKEEEAALTNMLANRTLAGGAASAVSEEELAAEVAKLTAMQNLFNMMAKPSSVAPKAPNALIRNTATQSIFGKVIGKIPGLGKLGAAAMPAAGEAGAESAGGIGGALGSIGAALPAILAVIVAVGAAVLVLWKNWSKIQTGIGNGLNILKSAFKGLISAVTEPFKNLWNEITGGGDKNSAAAKEFATTWKNVGTLLNGIFHGIAEAIKLITPIVSTVASVIANVLGAIYHAFAGVVAMFTLNFSAMKTEGRAAFKDLAQAVLVLLGGALKVVIDLITFIPRLLITVVQGVVDLASKIPGVGSKLKGLKDGLSDIKDSMGNWGNVTDNFVSNLWPDDTKDKVVGKVKDTGNAVKDQVENTDTGTLPAPDTSPMTQSMAQAGTDFVNELKSQMGSIANEWKSNAIALYEATVAKQKSAMDKTAKIKKDAIDDQISDINRQEKAEEELAREQQYLADQAKIRNEQANENINFKSEFDAYKYEGKYGEAQAAAIKHNDTISKLNDEYIKNEDSHQKDLAKQALEDKKQQLQDEKQAIDDDLLNKQTAADKTVEINRKALQDQLDNITKYTPKTAEEAQKMQDQIQAILRKFGVDVVNGSAQYGQLFTNNWQNAIQNTMAAMKDNQAWQDLSTQLGQNFSALGDTAVAAFLQQIVGNTAAPVTEIPVLPPNANTQPREDYGNRGLKKINNFFGGLGTGSGTRFVGGNNKSIFHAGGPIGADGAPQDVPAVLQTGEYVIQRRAVQRLGTSTLDRLNKAHTYHTGGLVGGDTANALTQRAQAAMTSWIAGGDPKTFAGLTKDQAMQDVMLSTGAGTGFVGGMPQASLPAYLGKMLSGVKPALTAMIEYVLGKFPQAIVTATTNGTHVNGSYHYKGQAADFDFGGSHSGDDLIFKLLQPFAQKGILAELFFDPDGGWKDGKQIGAIGGHMDHVHAAIADAFANGVSGGPNIPGFSGGSVQQYVHNAMLRIWPESEWPSLFHLIMGESGFNPAAKNPTSTAAGLFQFLDSTWMNYITKRGGPPYWTPDPSVQVPAGLSYIKERYGTPSNAFGLWQARTPHWYHSGGMVMNIPSLDTGGKIMSDGIAMVHKNERVLTTAQTAAYESGGSNEVHLHFDGGFFGTNHELDKLVDTIERKVLPKLNRTKGMDRTRVVRSY